MTDKVTRPRVVIVDDHCGVVNEIAALLRAEFDVVATASDGVSALDCIRRLVPDVVLLDLYMPGLNGLDVVNALKTISVCTVAVIMSGHEDPELSKAAIEAGAMAFVTKSRLMRDLIPALRAAVQGSVFVSS